MENAKTQTDTPPAAGTPSVTDTQDAVIQDLLGTQPPSGDPPAGSTEISPEDDAKLILMREDYLKKLNALNEREKALKEKEATAPSQYMEEMNRMRAEIEALKGGVKPQQAQQDGNPLMALNAKEVDEILNLEINPEAFQTESEKALATGMQMMQSLLSKVVPALRTLHEGYAQSSTLVQSSQQKMILGLMRNGSATIETKYGVKATPEEVGEALKLYGRTIIAQNGGQLPEDAGLLAWEMANARRLLSTLNKPAAEQRKAPAPPTSDQTQQRRPAVTKEESILADLGSW